MTCGGNRGKGPTPPFPPFPPLLEIPQKTRDFHIPTATTTSGLRLTQNRTPKPQKPNPGKIEGLVRFSCRAPFFKLLYTISVNTFPLKYPLPHFASNSEVGAAATV